MTTPSVPPELAAAIARKEGRLTDEIEFALPIEPSSERAIVDVPDAPEGVAVRSRTTGVGRGWSGEAEAVYIAVTGSVALLQLSAYVMAVWKRLRERFKGDANVIAFSLGAAKHLCLADLAARRADDVDGIELLWSGDVGQGTQHDVSHSGDDIFCLVFARNDATWVYVIDSTGGLIAFVEGDPLAKHTVNRLFGVGLDYDAAPEEPRRLLGDTTD